MFACFVDFASSAWFGQCGWLLIGAFFSVLAPFNISRCFERVCSQLASWMDVSQLGWVNREFKAFLCDHDTTILI